MKIILAPELVKAALQSGFKNTSKTRPLDLMVKGMGGLLLVCVIFFIYQALVFFSFNTKPTPPTVPIDNEAPLSKADKNKLSPLVFQKNIFRSLDVPVSIPTARPVAAPVVPQVSLRQRASYLKLVGVMNGEAIIEDTRQRTTKTLSAGQNIDEMMIEAVQSDRIILRYEDETLELLL
jgi:hypothetical protein